MKRRILRILSIAILGTGILVGCGNNKLDTGNSENGMPPAEESYKAEITEDVAAEAAADESSGSASQLAQNNSYNTDGSDISTTQAGNVAPQHEKLIYTYHYSVETKEFDDFYNATILQAQKLGGYIQESETNGSSVSDENRYARIVLRIPADKRNQMLSMVQKESNVTYSNVTTDNVTLNYVDMQSHIQALRKEQSTLLDLIEKAKKIDDLIALQSQLTEIRYEIESYESQLRTMDNLITYSTIHLDITEVQRTTTVTGSKTSMGEEIKNKFSDNLYAVGKWLQALLVWFISSLPILIPLGAIIVLILVWFSKRKKYRKERSAPSKTTPDTLNQDTNATPSEPAEASQDEKN